MDEVFTLNEVADLLKLNRSTVRDAIDRKELPAAKLGRQWRISRNDLNVWLQAAGSVGLSESLVEDDQMLRIRTDLAKLQGTLYRLLKRVDPKAMIPDDVHIYGLLKGIEPSVLEEFGHPITAVEYNAVIQALDQHWSDTEKLEAFRGYYDLETIGTRSVNGVDRGTTMLILRKFWLGGSFFELLKKMNSEHSPIECKDFDVDPDEL